MSPLDDARTRINVPLHGFSGSVVGISACAGGHHSHPGHATIATEGSAS